MDPATPPLVALEGADVLSDSLRIAFRRARPEFITVFFERHQVLRFGNAEAVGRYTAFSLPESLDPPYDHQDLPLARRDSLPRPIHFNTEVVFCRARKLGAQADTGALPIDGRVIRQRVKHGERFHEVWSYGVNVLGVQPGDTIEVQWKYSVPFLENAGRFNAQRIFFHGALYKHRNHLLLEADGAQGIRHWGIPADSVSEHRGTTSTYWNLRGLVPVADEVGARWHTELPHLVIGTLQDAQFNTHRTRSGLWVDVPYWVQAIRRREANAFWWRQVALKNVPDAQTERMKDFIERFPGTSGVDRMRRMHNTIANDFLFQLDDAWFDNKDLENQRMGDQLRDGRLREISRYDLYSKLIAMMRTKYWTAYLMDSRVGALSLDWLSPVWNNEWTFLLRDGDEPLHLYPKRSRHGLLAGEMPFYWEGTQALVGDVDKLWSDAELGAKEPIKPELVPIPSLTAAVNERRTDIRVEADLSSGLLKVEANILLAGQWSTLTRGAYLHGAVDSSVNVRYGHKLQDVPGARNVLVELGRLQEEAPYRMPIKVSFELPGRIVPQGDGRWTVDLRELVRHVVDTTFKAEGRDLSYWFDFAGLDLSELQVSFNRPVTATVVGAKEELEAVSYTSNAEQPDDRTVRLSSELRVMQCHVPPADAGQLEHLMLAVGSNTALRFTVVASNERDGAAGP
ncbi:MAG: hypothetical protein IPJ76_12090 [Flavobacteriales bacterium]|nr:MAG: hypothetical protein IPJ76_12090 [Flavobacteriales bacterium]